MKVSPEWTSGLRWTPCEACGQERSVHAHHVIYAQHCKRHHLPLYDPRNRMLLCYACHAAHHARTRLLVIPADHPVRDFAAEHGVEWLLERTYQRRAVA